MNLAFPQKHMGMKVTRELNNQFSDIYKFLWCKTDVRYFDREFYIKIKRLNFNKVYPFFI